MKPVLRPSGEPYMWAEVRDGKVNLKFANMPKYIISFAEQALPQLMEILGPKV